MIKPMTSSILSGSVIRCGSPKKHAKPLDDNNLKKVKFQRSSRVQMNSAHSVERFVNMKRRNGTVIYPKVTILIEKLIKMAIVGPMWGHKAHKHYLHFYMWFDNLYDNSRFVLRPHEYSLSFGFGNFSPK